MPPRAVNASAKKDTKYIASKFELDLSGFGLVENLTEVSGLSVEVEMAEAVSTGSLAMLEEKRPGHAKFTDITVKRKFSADRKLYDLVKKNFGRGGERFDGSIIIYSVKDGKSEETGRWNFLNATAYKWSVSDLDVKSDATMDETVTMKVEYLQRVK